MQRALLLVVAANVLAVPVRAQQPPAPPQPGATEIFKCKGADGHWTYTNDRREAERQKCEVVTRQINVAPTPKPAARAAPGSFPKETPADRATASARQRDILEKELAQEQAALAKAKADLAEQESVRSGNER